MWGRTGRHPPDRMAWLAGPGVYFGHLELEGLEPGAADTVLDNHSLIPFPEESTGSGGGGGGGGAYGGRGLYGGGGGGVGVGVPPLSMAATAHHVMVLFPSHIVAVNVVTGDVANTIPLARLNPLGGGDGGGYRSHENARCLATDVSSGTVYLVTATALLEVTAHDEGRDMWRVHLERAEYSLALDLCTGAAQRGAVHLRQAEVAARPMLLDTSSTRICTLES